MNSGDPFFDGFIPGAHRGASRHFPENTLEAFRRALEILPHCMIETDVRVTADGAVIVFHDADLDRVTEERGSVAEATLSRIRTLDAGYGITFDGGSTFPFRGAGCRVPILDEALDLFPSTRFSIDIKDDDRGAAARVLDVIDRAGASGRVIIGSFHDRIIRFVMESAPAQRRSCSKNEILRFITLQRIGAACMARPRGRALFIPEFAGGGVWEQGEVKTPGFRVVTQRLMRDAHRRGLPVVVWTINRRDNMERLIDWGVDGIVTDHIDLLAEVMAEKGLITPGVPPAGTGSKFIDR